VQIRGESKAARETPFRKIADGGGFSEERIGT